MMMSSSRPFCQILSPSILTLHFELPYLENKGIVQFVVMTINDYLLKRECNQSTKPHFIFFAERTQKHHRRTWKIKPMWKIYVSRWLKAHAWHKFLEKNRLASEAKIKKIKKDPKNYQQYLYLHTIWEWLHNFKKKSGSFLVETCQILNLENNFLKLHVGLFCHFLKKLSSKNSRKVVTFWTRQFITFMNV